MSGPVKSPRVFGRPLWAWAGPLVNRWRADRPEPLWRCRVARRVLWPLCRLLTGHRQALGETGYGGGGMLDVFCAYCFFEWQVPAEEMPSKSFLVESFHDAAGKPHRSSQ